MTAETPALYRAVYLSRNTMDLLPQEMAAEIDQILAASRRNNSAAGVSGALMFNAGSFGQVLEGTHQEVSKIFERIQIDRRHDHVEVLSFEQVTDRAFPDWSMAFVGTDSAALTVFADLVQNRSRALTSDRMMQLLLEHVQQHESATF